jgi:hypothetical protein
MVSDNNFLSMSTLSKFATMCLIFEPEFWREKQKDELTYACHKIETKLLQNVTN